MKVIIVGAHSEAKQLINRISAGWSISVIDIDQETRFLANSLIK